MREDQPPRDDDLPTVDSPTTDAVPHEEQATTPSRFRVEVEYDRCINYAMQQNDVPVIKYLRITNIGDTGIDEVELRIGIDNQLSAVIDKRKSRLEPGDLWCFDTLDLTISAAVLLSQQEREATMLRLELSWDGQIGHREALPLEILAYNEWGGLDTLPEILAAFVTPNQDAVARLLGSAAGILKAQTGDSSLSGYQTGNPQRVADMVRACYAAIAALRLDYISPPASFEDRGQKVRFPRQIEEMRLATCLDLSLLVAACLEQCGLHPLIFMIKGHSLAGAWTSDTCLAEPCTDDVARVRKHLGLGDMIAFETTMLTHDPAAPFEEAEASAARSLEDSAGFLCAIDIRAARKLRIRPLPLRQDLAAADPTAAEDPATTDAEAVAAAFDGDRSAAEPALVADPASPPEPATPETRLENWKHKLLDLSLRNRLINFRETKRTIPLLCHDLNSFEDAMARGGSFSISARPELGEGPRDLGLHRERTGEDALLGFLRDELGDRRLHADLRDEELDQRLLTTYREARNSLEETGTNTLFLALGFLNWYETESSTKQRTAPIILLPLQLTRRSIQDGFRIRLSDDDPRINVTLLKKLEKEFQVDVSKLDDLPEDDSGLDIQAILDAFSRAVVNLTRWEVRARAQIGMFSFNKFLMWQDLEENASTLMAAPVVRHLVETPGEKFGTDEGWPDARSLDRTHPPIEVLCPLDADSSQLRAVFAAHLGKTFVLQGPPGTGKSQTIANLIAHALGHGQRVLFVAEKMAALNVVHDRLSKIGLASACLELHSNKASKRQVLDQIKSTLEQSAAHHPAEWQGSTERLQQRRSELNRYVEAIHAPTPIGLSLFQATSQLIGLAETPHLELQLTDVEGIDRERLAQLHELIDDLADAADALPDLAKHPLRALEIDEYRARLPRDLEDQTEALQQASAALQRARLDLTQALALPPGDAADRDSESLLQLLAEFSTALLQAPGAELSLLTEPGFSALRLQLEQQLAAGRRHDELRASIRGGFTEAFLAASPEPWLQQLDRTLASLAPLRWWRSFMLRRGMRRFAKVKLPDLATIRGTLIELQQLQELQQRLTAASNPAATAFGRRWANGAADWSQLQAQLDWVENFRGLLLRLAATELDEDAVLPLRHRLLTLATVDCDTVQGQAPDAVKLRAYLAQWQGLHGAIEAAGESIRLNPELAFGDREQTGYINHIGAWAERALTSKTGLRDWCQWRRQQRIAGKAGLEGLVRAAESGQVEPTALRRVFDRDLLDALVCHLTDANDLIRRFNSHQHEHRIEEFRALDREVMELSKQVVQAQLGARVPELHEDASSKSEMGILARQLKLKTRHMSIRRLFDRLPTLLPQLKPCLLMSPLSVAQYLSTRFAPADLVIFDEASQIPVWDAIGALARGRSAVVVGDSKQLPPTNFFQRADSDEDETEDDMAIQEMESILDECEVAGLPTLNLDWHYRSRHESLIVFSNHHYYNNRLLTFPSAADAVPGLGVSLRHLPGAVYDKGKSRTNRDEAVAICAEIVERLQSYRDLEHPPSIGVVSFSQVQQTLIEDLLEAARRKHPEIERHFGDEVQEPVFIKNLENVQGDERDTIMFSICYGPDLHRKVTMGFGPLNRQGGERRLNVAITRARCELLVFASIKAEHIDLRRTQALGVRHLKSFLDYADRGAQALADAVTLDPTADFDSPFEQEVYQDLLERGHQVDIQVGCSGYRIDLAVRHPEFPGRYILGIECDGATYHSAATARDRDRIRESVLRGLGWQLHRIWSTDWWEDRAGQIARAEAAIAEALRQDARDTSAAPETQAAIVAEDPPRFAAAASPIAEQEPETAPQATYPLRPPAAVLGEPDDLHLAPSSDLVATRIADVVELEAPILFHSLCRRVAESFGIERVSARVRHRCAAVLTQIQAEHRPRRHGDFVWSPTQDPEVWLTFRVPATADPDPRKAEEIAPVEVANAAAYVLRSQFGLPMEELERETAGVFGISRLGSKVRQQMNQGICVLQARGGCVVEDGQVTVA